MHNIPENSVFVVAKISGYLSKEKKVTLLLKLQSSHNTNDEVDFKGKTKGETALKRLDEHRET